MGHAVRDSAAAGDVGEDEALLAVGVAAATRLVALLGQLDGRRLDQLGRLLLGRGLGHVDLGRGAGHVALLHLVEVNVEGGLLLGVHGGLGESKEDK